MLVFGRVCLPSNAKEPVAKTLMARLICVGLCVCVCKSRDHQELNGTLPTEP